MTKLLEILGLVRVDFDMCMHGLRTWASDGMDGAAKKPTSVFTNCLSIAEQLDLMCDHSHQHVPLLSNRAKTAGIYPHLFLDRILVGLDIQLAVNSEPEPIHHLTDMCEPLVLDSSDGDAMPDEETLNDHSLDPHEVQKARLRELKTFEEMQVWEYVKMSEALRDPEAILVDTTWVDLNKGSRAHPNYKSRLCAREFAKGGKSEMTYL